MKRRTVLDELIGVAIVQYVINSVYLELSDWFMYVYARKDLILCGIIIKQQSTKKNTLKHLKKLCTPLIFRTNILNKHTIRIWAYPMLILHLMCCNNINDASESL